MSRRIKYLDIAPELLVSFGQRGIGAVDVTANPLPDDAKIVDALWPFHPRTLRLFIESDTFPEVGPLDVLTQLDSPMFTARPEASVTPEPTTLTLSPDDLAQLRYDLERSPSRRVAVTVKAGGTWESRPGK